MESNGSGLGDSAVFSIEDSPALSIEVGKLREAEARIPEIRNVSPATYADLELIIGQAYREQKSAMRKIEVHILKAKAELTRLSNVAIFDRYPLFLEQNPKVKDSTDTRGRYIDSDPDIVAAKERLGNLEIMYKICGDKVDYLEHSFKALRKNIDLIVKSGVPFKMY